tara:strand:- start:113 stop:289 length:177 start_codon:yes stop_codon:yes gene_type:complete
MAATAAAAAGAPSDRETMRGACGVIAGSSLADAIAVVVLAFFDLHDGGMAREGVDRAK